MLPAFRFSPLALLVAASLHAHADEPVALELNDVVVTEADLMCTIRKKEA